MMMMGDGGGDDDARGGVGRKVPPTSSVQLLEGREGGWMDKYLSVSY